MSSAALPARRAPIAALLLATACLPLRVATAQQEQRAFAELPTAAQQQVLQRVAARLREHPLARRISAVAAICPTARELPTRTWHDEQVFAPVAAQRRLVGADEALHRRTRAAMPPVSPMAALAPGVVYDWGSGRVVQAGPEPTATERFATLLAGFAPDSDKAVAAVLAHLDTDGGQRAVARWLEQLYADRDGRVFADITLYEAWYSGRTVEVPDVDAIAFARQIVVTDSFVSPIPDGRRRDRLYRQIRAAFASHREYRTLRESLALAFVNVDPPLDPTYATLLPRLQHLWGSSDFDIAAVERRLGGDDRATILEVLDRELAMDGAARARARDALAELGKTVRAVALEELTAAR